LHCNAADASNVAGAARAADASNVAGAARAADASNVAGAARAADASNAADAADASNASSASGFRKIPLSSRFFLPGILYPAFFPPGPSLPWDYVLPAVH
jgi:hypothetical protein